jgi:AcrR family transcriptional regulator
MAARADGALRKDAADNRDRLLAAARELFAERGLGVTLNDIAHHAGVGVGTAYRRFANKEAVIDAIFEEQLRDLAALADKAAQAPDAWEALVGFLEQSLGMQFGDRGLNEVMNAPILGLDRISAARDQIAPLIKKLVDRAVREGAVRPDLDQSDLIFIQLGLSAIMDSSRAIAPELYRRYLTMFLDGIRTNRDTFTPLPAEALTPRQTHDAMTTRRRERAAAGRTSGPPGEARTARRLKP